MFRYYFTFTVLFIATLLQAQFAPKMPYEKIIFKDIAPIYHTTFHDPVFRDYDSDGYNCFSDLLTIEPLIYDNYIFMIHHNSIGINVGRFGNYYISCFDLDTGQFKWRQQVFLRDTGHIEIPRLWSVNDNNELVITGQKRIKTTDNHRNWFGDLILYHRTYDIATGNFISLKHRPFDDPDAYHTNYELFKFNILSEAVPEQYSIIEKINTDGKNGYKSFVLDQSGALISDPDTVFYDSSTGFLSELSIAPIGKDSMVMLEQRYDDDDHGNTVLLKYLTGELKPIGEVSIQLPESNGFQLPYLRVAPDKSKILISVWRTVGDETYPFEHILQMITDKKGNILNQVRFRIDRVGIYDWNDNKFKGVQSLNNISPYGSPNVNAIEFYECYGDFNVTLIREHPIADTLRTTLVTNFFRYKDKDIVFLTETAYYKDEDSIYKIDNAAFATSIAAFKKGDFIPDAFVTSIHDEALAETTPSDLFIYPNPVSDLLYVLSQPNTRINIYDIYGRLVLSQEQHDRNGQIDISNLNNGIYFLKSTNAKGIHTGSTIRFVKAD